MGSSGQATPGFDSEAEMIKAMDIARQRYAQAIREVISKTLKSTEVEYEATTREEDGVTVVSMTFDVGDEKLPFNIMGMDLLFAYVKEEEDEGGSGTDGEPGPSED